MSLHQQIEDAFCGRKRPDNLIERRGSLTPEQQDAMCFGSHDWREITYDFWESHPDAVLSFAPDAFVYYLPSILSESASNKNKWISAADVLISILDRSPNPKNWDLFLTKRLIGLEDKEYEAIKAWLSALSGTNIYTSEEGMMRAYETVDLLEKETKRLRQLVENS